MTEPLSDKTLVMIVGPAGIGKSTVMHAATALDSRFGYVRSFTTRPNRDGPATTYRHISDEQAKMIEQSGAAVTYFRHPTTGYAYGTDEDSYPTEFNLLDTLSVAVDGYRTLPFRRSVTISLTTDADTWQRWLFTRYPEPSPERTKRLREAVQSIGWSLSQSAGHHWLVNRNNQPEVVANQLLSLAIDGSKDTTRPPEATALYERAKLLLSYEEKEVTYGD